MAPQRKFAGLAYWRLAQAEPGWADLATEAVQPLIDHGSVLVHSGTLGEGSQELILEFAHSEFSMTVKNGEGRGVVRDTPHTLETLLCLLAMRRKLPSMSLVDDDMGEFPKGVSQQYSLFADNWDATWVLADLLGLVPNKRFLENEGSIVTLMF